MERVMLVRGEIVHRCVAPSVPVRAHERHARSRPAGRVRSGTLRCRTSHSVPSSPACSPTHSASRPRYGRSPRSPRCPVPSSRSACTRRTHVRSDRRPMAASRPVARTTPRGPPGTHENEAPRWNMIALESLLLARFEQVRESCGAHDSGDRGRGVHEDEATAALARVAGGVLDAA